MAALSVFRRREKLTKGIAWWGRWRVDPAVRRMVRETDRYSRARAKASRRGEKAGLLRNARWFFMRLVVATVAVVSVWGTFGLAYVYVLPESVLAAYSGPREAERMVELRRAGCGSLVVRDALIDWLARGDLSARLQSEFTRNRLIERCLAEGSGKA